MDINKLRDIVNRKDGEGFCQFFRQLKPEEALRLSNEEYQEIMNLVEQLGKEAIIRDELFFAFLYDTALEYLKMADSDIAVRPTAFLSLFYNDILLIIYPINNEIFALSLMHKGFSLRILAEQGDETIEKLKESIKCYDKAAHIFQKEKAYIDYARNLVNKGGSLSRLAEQGVNTTENLRESIKCFNEAAFILQKEKAYMDYARALMNKGNSLSILAELGVNTIDNLKKAKKCLDKAAPIFKRESAELEYARTIVSKGNNLRRLAEQGVNTINNLEKSINCYDEAAIIFKEAGAELDYARTLMNKGLALWKLAKHEVDVNRSFATAMELYEEVEGIFLEKGSMLPFVMASANHIIGLWWRFLETNEENYLIQARTFCKKALEFAPQIIHPAKKDIEELLNRINDTITDIHIASKKEPREEIERELALISKKIDGLSLGQVRIEAKVEAVDKTVKDIDKKVDKILNSIKIQTEELINTIRQSGEEVSGEIAKGFTSLADDLKVVTEEKQRNLLEELCQLLKDSTFQNKLLNESPSEKRGLIKSIFHRIKETANEIAGHMPSALVAHQILFYFDQLCGEVLHLSDINSAIVKGMVLLPFIAFKDRLFKS